MKNDQALKILQTSRIDIKNLIISFSELKKINPYFFGGEQEFIRDDWDVWDTNEILEHLLDDIDNLLKDERLIENLANGNRFGRDK